MDNELRMRMSPLSQRANLGETTFSRPFQYVSGRQDEDYKPFSAPEPTSLDTRAAVSDITSTRTQSFSRAPTAKEAHSYPKIKKQVSREHANYAARLVINGLTSVSHHNLRKNTKRIFRPSFLMPKRLITRISIVGAVLILLTSSFMYFSSASKDNTPSLVANLSRPNFSPFVPIDGARYSGEASKIVFNNSTDSYSFDDSYLGVPILVFEQPMQSNHNKTITAQQIMSSLIQKLGANNKISFQNGTAFIANATKSSRQKLVFSEKGILVFIQSSLNIDQTAWTSYIDKLQQT